MNKLLTLTVILYSLMFSSVSFGEWTEVAKNNRGDIFYVDEDRIRDHNGYVYYWELSDYLEPLTFLDVTIFSQQIYIQADCSQFRYKSLNIITHKQPMGRGIGETQNPFIKEWRYPPPNSVNESLLQFVCKK